MKTKIEQALIKCGRLHADTNHLYDDMPYQFHLEVVVAIAEKFIHLIPEKDRDDVLIACAAHDLIEDARLTYNDVKSHFNTQVAEIVYALTNDKGKSRKERAGKKYYEGIRTTPYASFVKLCDRFANVSYSKSKGSRMFNLYKNEQEEFMLMVLPEGHRIGELADALNDLFEQ